MCIIEPVLTCLNSARQTINLSPLGFNPLTLIALLFTIGLLGAEDR